MLKSDKLCGAIVYYDGQQDDARMCLAVALTAARHGATVTNHVEVQELLKKKDENGQEVLCGAKLKDMLTNKEWTVKAKCIINATGPFTDSIRKMDDPAVKEICCPSSGVHIVLPGYYSPQQMGLLDPATSDGRVIFFLPWQRQTSKLNHLRLERVFIQLIKNKHSHLQSLAQPIHHAKSHATRNQRKMTFNSFCTRSRTI
jgi:glycerol-3-phosphate dehydrogenase